MRFPAACAGFGFRGRAGAVVVAMLRRAARIAPLRRRSLAGLILLLGLPAPPSGAAGAEIPIEAAVYAVTRSDGAHMTYIDIVVGSAAGIGLPAGIERIEVTGPQGDLAIGRGDFEYFPAQRDFWSARPGAPEIGRYRIRVSGPTGSGTATSVHAATRPLPIPDSSAFVPRRGEPVSCAQALFSWAPVHARGPLYYQLQVRAADRRRVFNSGYVRDLRSLRLPPKELVPGERYEWRVRVADAADWVSLDNRAQSRWSPFYVDASGAGCNYRYRRPLDTGDGWPTSGLAEQRIEREKIEQLIEAVSSGRRGMIDGVLLARNGRLVLEEYFDGYHLHALHALYSVSKSVTSLLVGIALDRGRITSVHEPVYRFFPDRRGTRWVDERYGITLEHVLTMSAGVDWDETVRPLDDPDNDLIRSLAGSRGVVDYVLDKPQIEPPGTRWNYNSGLTSLLGAVVRVAAGEDVEQFARRGLFGPLGIDSYRWLRHRDGTVDTGGGLALRPRDLAKIGQLMLDGGRWAGRRVVSASWVEASTRAHVEYAGRGYGYQWYRGKTLVRGTEVDAYWAWGYGGQLLFVFPELGLISVFTSRPVDTVGHYMKEPGLYEPFRMLDEFILPAVVSPAPAARVPLRAADLDSLTGTYRLPGGATVRVSREGDVFVARRGSETVLRATAVTGDLLVGTSTEVGDIRVRVRRGLEGAVTGATVYHFPFSRQAVVKVD